MVAAYPQSSGLLLTRKTGERQTHLFRDLVS
jgi:hypothetical protein